MALTTSLNSTTIGEFSRTVPLLLEKDPEGQRLSDRQFVKRWRSLSVNISTIQDRAFKIFLFHLNPINLETSMPLVCRSWYKIIQKKRCEQIVELQICKGQIQNLFLTITQSVQSPVISKWQYFLSRVQFCQIRSEKFEEIADILKHLQVLLKHHPLNKLDEAEREYGKELSLAFGDRKREAECMSKIREIYMKRAEFGGPNAPKNILKALALCNYELRSQGFDRSDISENNIMLITILEELERKLYSVLEIDICPESDAASLYSFSLVFSHIIEKARKWFDEFFSELIGEKKKTETVIDLRRLNSLLSDYTKSIKIIIASEIKEIQKYGLGKAPCDYALIGFGSLANAEFTTYSDLEFGILIKEDTKSNKEYFRKLTYLLHARVINLGETMLRTLDIQALKEINFFDDFTPRGFSFDGEGVPGKGCKTPLGNGIFELIQTPEKMADFQNTNGAGKWWLEVEPHLPLELLNFTIIDEYGKSELSEKYRNALKEKMPLNYNETYTMQEFLSTRHLLEEDIVSFDMSLDNPAKEGSLFHIKKEIYRQPRLVIDRLCLRYFGEIKGSYCEKLENLEKEKVIPSENLEILQKAICATNLIRLSSYMNTSSQKDYKISMCFSEDSQNESASELSSLEYEALMLAYKPLDAFCKMGVEILKGQRQDMRAQPVETEIDNLLYTALRALRFQTHQDTEAQSAIDMALKEAPKNYKVLAVAGIFYQKLDLSIARQHLMSALKRGQSANATEIDLIHIEVSLSEVNLHLYFKNKSNQKYYDEAFSAIDKAYHFYRENEPLQKSREYLSIISDRMAVVAWSENRELIKEIIFESENFLRFFDKKSCHLIEMSFFYTNLAFLYSRAYVLGENKEKYKLEKLGKYANEALKIKNTIFPSKHPSRASSLAFIGDYHFEVEKFDQAEKCFEECYSIYRSHGDRRHDDVYKQIVNNYYHILIKLCKYEKAEIVLFDFLKDLGSRDKTTNFPDILKFRELHIKICFSLKINKDDIPSSHFALIKKRIDDHNTCLDNLLGSYRSGYDENIDVETV